MRRRVVTGVIVAVLLAGIAVSVCVLLSAAFRERVLIAETENVRIEREGFVIHVQDIKAGTGYAIRPVRVRRTAAAEKLRVRRLISTENVEVISSGRLLIITDKPSGRRWSIRLR